MPYICKEALIVLIDEPPELSKLYLCLAEVMDYDTCTAGISYRINSQFLKERLSIAETNGRKAYAATRQKVRSTLTRMVKVKLIVDQGKYVFLLPFEKRHQSHQKSYNPRYNPSNNPTISHKNPSNSVTYTNPETINNPSNNPRYNTPLYNNTNNSNLGGVEDEFSMTLSWQCNRDLIKSYLARRGDDAAAIDLDWMVEFQGFWSTKPNVLRTQRAWDIQLANYLSKFIRHPDLFDRLNGLSESNYPNKTNHAQNGGNQHSGGFIPAIPRVDEALASYAQQHGFPVPADGDNYAQYRAKLISLRTARLDAAQQPNNAIA